MATQNSVISYVPQPYFIEGDCSVSEIDGVDAIENPTGLFNPDLSDYTTIVATPEAQQIVILINAPRNGAHLEGMNVSLAFIGCALLTYEDDGGGNPDLETEFSEDLVCKVGQTVGTTTDQVWSYAHNSQDKISTFCKQSLPGIISGGAANVVFYGLGTVKSPTTDQFTAFFVFRSYENAQARPHARIIIGHVFVGIDLPVIINPRTFSWTLEAQSQRFTARDTGTIGSEGTLLRQANCEIIKIPNDRIIGSVATELTTTILATTQANFFDLVKINNSYPLLFNPYPVVSVKTESLTLENANLTARQNFFSIYGFMDDALELQVGEYRDGLDSEYRARFRIRETR